jgi:hypothetical protein
MLLLKNLNKLYNIYIIKILIKVNKKYTKYLKKKKIYIFI